MKLDPKDEVLVRALLERHRSLSVDLAAAKAREIENRLANPTVIDKIRKTVLLSIKHFPFLYRYLLILKNKIS